MTPFVASRGGGGEVLNKALSLRLGVGGYSTKFYTGRLRPDVRPLTILCTILGRKGTPFLLPTINIWYPFHIPNLELCITFG